MEIKYILLDTDTYNECDDQFALAYILKSQDIFNIDAITIAPYSHNTNRVVSVKDGQELSYNEILKIDKIKVIWLGGNELGYKDNHEYNFRQDIDANRIVFHSNVDLTIIPCKNVASILKIDIDTLKNNLKNNELNNYLIDRFYNDGYHGIQNERVIWDISVIAYMINKNWFKTEKLSCPYNILSILVIQQEE